MNRSATTPNRSGFTLIELLVVLAIVGVLFSLLLPATLRAQGKSRKAACFNNLRQLGLAWELYTEDHAGVFPHNDVEFAGRFSNRPGSWVLGNAQLPRVSDLELGTLFPYTRNAVLNHCPADRSFHEAFGRRFPKLRTYSLSEAFNTFGAASIPATSLEFRAATRSSDIPPPGPSGIASFIDMHEDAIDSGEFAFLWAGGRPVERWEHKPTDRHGGGANFAFADGHVEFKKWLHPKRFARYGEEFAGERDRQDWLWMVDRLPRK